MDEEAGASTDYKKIAKAIGDIKTAGIEVSLVNINKSDFGFTPDVENNKILFGLKGILNVGEDVIQAIIENRPFVSPRDFLNKVNLNKRAMISLIKGGAFDEMMDRKFCMAWYIYETCDKKKRITLQNMGGLMKYDLLPKDEESIFARKVYEFNRYLKAICKFNATHYKLDERAIKFLYEIEQESLIEEKVYLNMKKWDKIYQSYMDIFRNWIASNREEILDNLNALIFQDDWNKYARGTISAWEMEVLCFYYHPHELIDVNYEKYNFSNFFLLPEDPEVERSFYKGGKEIKLFKLHKICGTCIAKNKDKGIVTLLTINGVVEVKFRKEYFSLFDRQISKKNPDGTKTIIEKSWFNRGNMIAVTGIRSGDTFIAKKYASTPGHTLLKIEEVVNGTDLRFKSERSKGEIEEDV